MFKSLPRIRNLLLALLLITLSSAGTFGYIVSAAPGPRATVSTTSVHYATSVGHFLTSLGTTHPMIAKGATQTLPGTAGVLDTRGVINRAIPSRNQGGVKPAVVPVPIVTTLDKVTGGAAGAPGLTALDNRGVNDFNLEPPDQGLCVGNGFVVEPVNDVLAIYDTSFNAISGDIALNPFYGFGLQKSGGNPSGTGPFISDPKCLYDTATGHWFVTATQISDTPTTWNGAFDSTDKGFLDIAVSATNNPTGAWKIYQLDVHLDGLTCTPNCLGDQPLLGANKDALILSTNAFSISGPGFDGAQVYLIDKIGLSKGFLAGLINVAYVDVGDFYYTGVGGFVQNCSDFTNECWYSLQPATSPDASQYDTGACNTTFARNKCGVEYFLSAMDFFGAGDTRIALWAAFQTTTLIGGPACGGISGPPCGDNDVFIDEQTNMTTEAYVFPPNAAQKAGLIPLGLDSSSSEGPIASNDDRMNQVVYAQGLLWGGVNTALTQHSHSSFSVFNAPETGHVGIAYFVVHAKQPTFGHTHPLGSLTDQGYVAPFTPNNLNEGTFCSGTHTVCGDDAVFPSIGVGPTNPAVMTFTLTGKDFYPTVAYAKLTSSSHGLSTHTIFVSNAGTQPQDGFTEYSPPPRWGDYSAAVWSGGKVYIAAEYIGSACANDANYEIDPSCGGTRANSSNWWTGLNAITTP